MGLFSRKPKTSIDELCQQFYDNYIFGNTEFSNNAFHFIIQEDVAQSIDENIFLRELWALRIELFGLALWNYNLKLPENDDYQNEEMLLIEEVCAEIKFTKKYLEMNKKLDVWEAMAFYNKEIAQAVTEKPFVNLSGLFPFLRIEGDEEDKRKSRLDTMEYCRNIFYEPFKRFITDSECLTRLINRVGSSENEWSEGFISQALSRRFAERLGYVNKLNWEGIFKIQALIFGMYNGAQNFIETLPFLPENRERLNKLLKTMKRVAESRGND